MLGAGLGLSLVKKMVDSMGGTINTKSEVDVGTTLTVQLPLVQHEALFATSKPISALATSQGLLASEHVCPSFAGRRVKMFSPSLTAGTLDCRHPQVFLRASLINTLRD